MDICPENDREWSDFSIYLALPLEHCLSAVGASLREAAYISVCRKIVGTNVFAGHISISSLSVRSQPLGANPQTPVLKNQPLTLKHLALNISSPYLNISPPKAQKTRILRPSGKETISLFHKKYESYKKEAYFYEQRTRNK